MQPLSSSSLLPQITAKQETFSISCPCSEKIFLQAQCTDSSPEAICKSLTRRLERLTEKLKDSQLTDNCSKFDSEEDNEDYAATYVSASQTASELHAEIQTLKLLVRSAEEVRNSGQDVK